MSKALLVVFSALSLLAVALAITADALPGGARRHRHRGDSTSLRRGSTPRSALAKKFGGEAAVRFTGAYR